MATNSTLAPKPSVPVDTPDKTHPATRAGQALLEAWIAAVGARDPAAAASLYAEKGMAFWGTFGDYCRTSQDEAQHYFERFLAVDSIACSIERALWRPLGNATVLVTGTYAFTIARDGDPATTTRARFTFVFQRMHKSPWKILEHHSSLFPANGY